MRKSDTKLKVTNKDIKYSNKKEFIKETFPHIVLIIMTMLSWKLGSNKLSMGRLIMKMEVII